MLISSMSMHPCARVSLNTHTHREFYHDISIMYVCIIISRTVKRVEAREANVAL